MARNHDPGRNIASLRATPPLGGNSNLESEDPNALLAHLDLAHLAGDRHGELVDDVDVARDLVVRQLARRECLHGVDVKRRRAWLHPDPCADLLALLPV